MNNVKRKKNQRKGNYGEIIDKKDKDRKSKENLYPINY